jgi:hypothetical protein
MTKRQDLYLQRRSRSEQSDQRQPNQAKNISHQPRASPNSTPLISRIEFPTMTRVEALRGAVETAAIGHGNEGTQQLEIERAIDPIFRSIIL